MKKNQLTTHKSSSLLLGKSKSLMKITKKLLESKSKELTDHKDITIIGDLMWEKKESREMSWDEGMEYAKNLRLGGYDDWRLPTKEELGEVVTLCGGEFTILDDDYEEKIARNSENVPYQEAYKAIGFYSNYYWSSTALVGNEDYAWVVDFYNGRDYWNRKSNSYYVRCVRDGQ